MKMGIYEELECLHDMLQEAINGNVVYLEEALELVEELREPYFLIGKEDDD